MTWSSGRASDSYNESWGGSAWDPSSHVRNVAENRLGQGRPGHLAFDVDQRGEANEHREVVMSAAPAAERESARGRVALFECEQFRLALGVLRQDEKMIAEPFADALDRPFFQRSCPRVREKRIA